MPCSQDWQCCIDVPRLTVLCPQTCAFLRVLVSESLGEVRTPFILVLQHDRPCVRPFDGPGTEWKFGSSRFATPESQPKPRCVARYPQGDAGLLQPEVCGPTDQGLVPGNSGEQKKQQWLSWGGFEGPYPFSECSWLVRRVPRPLPFYMEARLPSNLHFEMPSGT